MYFKNEKHRQAFEAGIKKANKKDKETLCLIYLLSADSCLWRRAKQSAGNRIIMLNSIRLTNISEDGYVFLGAAKDIKYGTKYLTLGDLTDRTLITPKVYKVLCQAMQLRRCGTLATQNLREIDE